MASSSAAARPPESVEFGDYVAVLRRRWTWPLVGLLLGIVGGYLFSTSQPLLYTANAALQVTPSIPEGSTLRPDQLVSMETEARLVQSGAVAAIARDDLGVSRPVDALLANVDAGYEPDSTILDIAFSADTPQAAADGADAFAAAYLEYKEREANERALDIQTDRIQYVSELRTTRANAVEALRAAEPGSTQANRISARIDALDLLIQQTRVAPLPGVAEPGYVISAAAPPTEPSSPNPPLNVALGGSLGLFLGTLLAFARDRVDQRVRGRGHLSALIDEPVLAVVPHVSVPRKGTWVAALDEPRGPAAEAYRTLRTNLLAMSARHRMKLVAVTSALPGEGKSTTSANLAVAVAQAGKRVLLISADLRAPGVSKLLGIPNTWGLVDVLRRRTPLEEVAQPTSVDKLHVINTGPIPQNPTELLQSKKMRQLLETQREIFDFVVVDCSPVLGLADALAVAQFVDGVILVASDRSKEGTILETRAELDQVGARLIGAILNDVPLSKLKKRSYGYGGTPYRYVERGRALEPASGNGHGNGERAVRKRGVARSARE